MDPLQIEQENAVKLFDDEDNVMNSTQDIIINWILRKSDCLVDDIKNIARVVQPSKRSGKIKSLDVEDFRFDVYLQNQSGFVTSQPINWALALEHYVKINDDVKCRWVHKKDKESYKISLT